LLQEQADEYAVLNAGLLDKHVGAFAHFSCNAYGSVAAQFLWQITDSSIPGRSLETNGERAWHKKSQWSSVSGPDLAGP
jgi:hypothetical protein